MMKISFTNYIYMDIYLANILVSKKVDFKNTRISLFSKTKGNSSTLRVNSFVLFVTNVSPKNTRAFFFFQKICRIFNKYSVKFQNYQWRYKQVVEGMSS